MLHSPARLNEHLTYCSKILFFLCRVASRNRVKFYCGIGSALISWDLLNMQYGKGTDWTGFWTVDTVDFWQYGGDCPDYAHFTLRQGMSPGHNSCPMLNHGATELYKK